MVCLATIALPHRITPALPAGGRRSLNPEVTIMKPLTTLHTHARRAPFSSARRVSTILGVAVAILAATAAVDVALAQDYNGDGTVDVCDEIVFATDFVTNNLRSDYTNDGVVNLADTAVFIQYVCDGPTATAAAGPATIGVYFDPAGTQTFLPSPPIGTLVDLYIVAHGVTNPSGIGGFTFKVTENSSSIIVSNDFLPDWLGLLYDDISQGICDMGGINTCLNPAATILLPHYVMLYLGQDTEITVQGANICDAPSVSPSYVSCGVDGTPCDWTYFGFDASNGIARIGPPVATEETNWSSLKAMYR